MADNSRRETISGLHEIIKINLIHNKLLIFNQSDVDFLRREKRIVGTLIGCLARSPLQNVQLGLPLQLTPEESFLLLEKGCAKIIDHVKNQRTPAEINAVMKRRSTLLEEQVDLYKEERKNKIESMADIIIAGKKRKLAEISRMSKSKAKRIKLQSEPDVESDNSEEEFSINRNSIIAEELSKVNPSKENFCIQIHTESLNKSEREVKWNFPITNEESNKYLVFKDLWEKGYYMTCGIKFGGDFLVYPGDPLYFHAEFVVKYINYSQPNHVLDFVLSGRLCTQVKKTFIIATVKPDKMVDYISMKWAGQL